MTAERLLRFYPPAWRARYGDEFLATVGDGPLGARTVFDIVMVAIDAWLSADVRNATRAFSPAADAGRPAESGGGMPMLKAMLQCDRARSGVTTRDGLIGAGIMLAMNVLLAGGGVLLHLSGWPATGEALKSLSFPVSFIVSMPWWLMKGTPRRAQGFIIGVTVLILIAATWIATKI